MAGKQEDYISLAKTRNIISYGMNKSEDSDDDVGSSFDHKNNFNVGCETDFDENDSKSLQNGECSESYVGVQTWNDSGRAVPTEQRPQLGGYGSDPHRDIDLASEDGKKKKKKKSFHKALLYQHEISNMEPHPFESESFQANNLYLDLQGEKRLESSSRTPVGASRTSNLGGDDIEEGVDGLSPSPPLNSEQLDVALDAREDLLKEIEDCFDHGSGDPEEGPPPASPNFQNEQAREDPLREEVDCLDHGSGGPEDDPQPASPIFLYEGAREDLWWEVENCLDHGSGDPEEGLNEQRMIAQPQDINLGGGTEQAPPPASTSTIESLPYSTVTAHQINDLAPCSICLSSFVVMDTTSHLTCNHIFHLHCIKAWLTKSAACPVCRSRVESPTDP